MIFLSILTLIVAIALPSLNKHISSILYVRITSLLFIYAGALSFNAFYIQPIGSGIGIYSELFQVTLISQLFDIFIVTIASLILVAWPIMSPPQHIVNHTDDETLSQLSNASNSSSKYLDGGNNLADIVNTYIQSFFEYFKYILEPVQVNYSNELLANQILDISVLLFFLSIIITGLIIVLLFIFII